MASLLAENLRAVNTTRIDGRALSDVLIRDGVSYAIFSQTNLWTRFARVRAPHQAGTAVRTRARGAKFFFLIATLWGLIRMALSRPRIVIYGTDRMGKEPFDERMGKVYRWLQNQQPYHGHLVHGTSEPGVYSRWWRRRGPTIYIEAFEIAASALLHFRRKTFPVPSRDNAVIVSVFERANMVAVMIPLLSRALKMISPKHLWLIDDTRYWPQIVMAARDANIKTVLFQHGRFTQYLEYLTYPEIRPDLIPIPDTYVVWNVFWARRLKTISPPFALHAEVIRVGGKPSIDQVPARGESAFSKQLFRILVVHEPVAPSDQVRAFIERLLALDDIEVIYKIRADIPRDAQVSFLGDVISHEHFTVSTTVQDCDLALGSYSTLLYELVQAGIPVGLLGISSLQSDLAEEGFATIVDPETPDLRQALSRIADLSSAERERRSKELGISVDIAVTCEQLLQVTHVRH